MGLVLLHSCSFYIYSFWAGTTAYIVVHQKKILGTILVPLYNLKLNLGHPRVRVRLPASSAMYSRRITSAAALSSPKLGSGRGFDSRYPGPVRGRDYMLPMCGGVCRTLHSSAPRISSPTPFLPFSRRNPTWSKSIKCSVCALCLSVEEEVMARKVLVQEPCTPQPAEQAVDLLACMSTFPNSTSHISAVAKEASFRIQKTSSSLVPRASAVEAASGRGQRSPAPESGEIVRAPLCRRRPSL